MGTTRIREIIRKQKSNNNKNVRRKNDNTTKLTIVVVLYHLTHTRFKIVDQQNDEKDINGNNKEAS